MRPATLQRWARRVTLTGAAAGALYLLWRYDLVRLPAEGCSPLWSVPVGRGLLVDVRTREHRPGDVVLYLDPAGAVRLGRLGPSPAGTARGALWVESDREDCPSVDSRDFGVLPEERVVGRLLVALPW